MSDHPKEELDRRDFIAASIATIGASAALAVNARAADAQSAATPSANPASGTVYTGDVIREKKVVSALDVCWLKLISNFVQLRGVCLDKFGSGVWVKYSFNERMGQILKSHVL